MFVCAQNKGYDNNLCFSHNRHHITPTITKKRPTKVENTSQLNYPRRLVETSNAGETRRMAIKIDGLDNPTLMSAFADEVGKVLERNVTLSLDAQSFVTAAVKLLDGTLEANAEGVSGEAKDLPYRARDTSAVRVNIVDGSELSGDLLLQAVGKRVRNLVQDVVCRCHGCRQVS